MDGEKSPPSKLLIYPWPQPDRAAKPSCVSPFRFRNLRKLLPNIALRPVMAYLANPQFRRYVILAGRLHETKKSIFLIFLAWQNHWW